MKRTKGLYPAFFHEQDGGYLVEFPDLKGCITEGDSYSEALKMAKEVANEYIIFLENNNRSIPKPSIKIKNQEIINYIEVDTSEYRDEVNKLMAKKVKKTLTISEYLNNLGNKKNINFSKLLQSALKKELGIK